MLSTSRTSSRAFRLPFNVQSFKLGSHVVAHEARLLVHDDGAWWSKKTHPMFQKLLLQLLAFSSIGCDCHLVASRLIDQDEDPGAKEFEKISLNALVEGAGIVDLVLWPIWQSHIPPAYLTLHHCITDQVEDLHWHANSCQEILQIAGWSMPVFFMETQKESCCSLWLLLG